MNKASNEREAGFEEPGAQPSTYIPPTPEPGRQPTPQPTRYFRRVEEEPQPRTRSDVERTHTGKKWLRPLVFGPANLICYECEEAVSVPYFSALRACPECGGKRFTLP